MQIIRMTIGIALRGALLGGLLAVMVPEKPLSAGACVCDDDGIGSYKCNGTQTACIPGGDVCNLRCG